MRTNISSPGFKSRARRGRGAFTLLEVMIATGLFVIVAVALMVVLNRTIEAEVEGQREQLVRMNLQSKLDLARLTRLKVGSVAEKPDDRGVTYETDVRLLDLKNDKGIGIANLYALTVRARWNNNAGEEETREAEIYVYQQ